MQRLSAKTCIVPTAMGRGLGFLCPGCGNMHVVPIEGATALTWNDDPIAPTIRQNIRTQHTGGVCHLKLTNGIASFHADSTHALAGQSAPLPDLPPE